MTQFWIAAWDWKPTVIAGCAALIAAYAALTHFRFSRGTAAWILGVGLIAIALVSPLDALADEYLFSAHMAKHLLFVLVIPALLLSGLPADPLRRLIERPPISLIERFLRHPAMAWICGIGVMALWHIPAIFNAALSHPFLHIVEHVSLLVGGTIYWWPILAPVPESRLRPVPEAAAFLFTSCLACTSMGILITFAGSLLYPSYAYPIDSYGMLQVIREQWGISPQMDQQIGGLIMWVPGCLVYLTAIMAMFARWYGEEHGAVAEAS